MKDYAKNKGIKAISWMDKLKKIYVLLQKLRIKEKESDTK